MKLSKSALRLIVSCINLTCDTITTLSGVKTNLDIDIPDGDLREIHYQLVTIGLKLYDMIDSTD